MGFVADQPSAAELVQAGQGALEDAQWSRARELFEAARTREETPEALEGLGLAADFLGDLATSLSMRERAYRLYRRRDDPLGAGRAAIHGSNFARLTEVKRAYDPINLFRLNQNIPPTGPA